ncbi:hypothetical protein ID866_689 [Astraeus odoratus]|nr:hypothetical protein ID866_689 [Astraeus odoratus]
MPAPASIAVASTPLDPATSKILIVGAGTFGLSTAYYLQEDGFRDVTVLDRAAKLPARDAASTDINKIVRSSYGDRFYTRLGREAIAKWKDPMWEGCYHESGVLSIGDACVDELHENDLAEGAPVVVLPDAESIRSTFPPSLRIPTVTQATSRSLHNHLGSFADYNGYFNQEGGWVEAARAVEILLNVVMARGAKLEGGKEVVMLLRSNTNKSVHTYGVKCTDGSTYLADRVVIATGSWTASSFPGLQLDKKCLATGQSVATIQLSSEEAERYRECPVILDFGTGFYTFPPNKDNIIKVAVHGAGHTHMVASSVPGTPSENRVPRKISTPRTILSHPQGSDGLRVPRSALYVMRDHLKAIYPELAQKAWAETRMCW